MSQSTPAGSTWSRSRSASCAANASTGGSSQRQLASEIAAWERQRNGEAARIKWMFTTEKARTKMGRAYPKPPFKKDHNHCATVLVDHAAAGGGRRSRRWGRRWLRDRPSTACCWGARRRCSSNGRRCWRRWRGSRLLLLPCRNQLLFNPPLLADVENHRGARLRHVVDRRKGAGLRRPFRGAGRQPDAANSFGHLFVDRTAAAKARRAKQRGDQPDQRPRRAPRPLRSQRYRHRPAIRPISVSTTLHRDQPPGKVRVTRENVVNSMN